MYIVQRVLYGIVRLIVWISGKSDVNNFDRFVIQGESIGVEKMIETLSLLKREDTVAYNHCSRYLTHFVLVRKRPNRGFYTSLLLLQPEVIELPVELLAGYIYRISILTRFTKNHVYFIGDHWHRCRICANILELALLNRIGVSGDYRDQQADIIKRFLQEGISQLGSEFRGLSAYCKRLERVESGRNAVYS